MLVLHVVAGSAALVLAAGLLVRVGSWHGRAGAAYTGLVVVVGGTAVVLAGPGSALPGGVRAALVAVAALTGWAAVSGRRRALTGRPGARRRLDGSVVSLVTAVAVVSAPVVAWVAVALVGTAVAEGAQARRGRRDVTLRSCDQTRLSEGPVS